MIELNKLKELTLEIYRKRNRNGAKLNEPLKHCAMEVLEAMEAKTLYEEAYFKYELEDPTLYEKELKNFGHELADIIICVLNCAAEYVIDIELAIREVIENNKLRALGKGDKR